MSTPEPQIPALVEEHLVAEALPMLNSVAATIRWQLGNKVPLDDLRSIGHFALTDLVRAYDPEIAPFEPYMRLHLRWAILDGLRKQTHSRAVTARASALVASERLARVRHEGSSTGATASPDAPSPPMPPSQASHLHRLRRILREHAAAMGISMMVGPRDIAMAPSSAQPEKAVMKRASHVEVKQAVAELTDPKMKILMTRHYFGGEPMMQVAADIGISRAWASRLHHRAIELLEKRLRGTAADPDSADV